MYTDCPACHRQFRIRAAHLGVARGVVQCGFCGQRYNALERLHDQPLPPDALPGPPVPESPASEPAATPAGTDPGDGFDIPAEIPAPGGSEAGAPPAGDPAEPGPEPAPESAPEQPWDLPPELLQEEPSGGKPRRLLWSLVLMLLLLAAVVQAAWFNRDRLLTEYPELLPWMTEVCDYLQCELIRHVDLDAIQVVNRDVRDHPRYDSALLVNATIVNRSGGVQPFPVVRLSLFDTAGNLIAYRRFQPAEYLDASVDREQGMLPESPVHIVLEVVGPTQGAVSFEFDFLPG